ncbi:MAG: hypothetical protein K2W82_18760 [Candidatus Obscuribacterales bacterium]|nr:hypothetical protein [Candidatus Obscuribacterales bacterium]
MSDKGEAPEIVDINVKNGETNDLDLVSLLKPASSYYLESGKLDDALRINEMEIAEAVKKITALAKQVFNCPEGLPADKLTAVIDDYFAPSFKQNA